MPQKKELDTLDETLASLTLFSKQVNDQLNIVLDEFQEITEIKESTQKEGKSGGPICNGA